MKSFNMNKTDSKNSSQLNHQNSNLSNNTNYNIYYQNNIYSIPPQFNIYQNNVLNNYAILNYINFQTQQNSFYPQNLNHQIINKENKKLSSNIKPKKKYQKEVLFQNTVNKEENDIKDFNNFCNCLKSDIPTYLSNQIGSRIMQKYLKRFPTEIRTILIKKIGKSFSKIMMDTYGNYFSQKLIKISTDEQRELIIENIKDNFIEICENNGGTHVIQTIIEYLKTKKEKEMILNYIKNYEMELSLNQNGTHVIKKIINSIEENEREDLTLNLLKETNIKILCVDSKGICIIRQLIKSIKNETYQNLLIYTIFKNCKNIAENPFGNYVIQFIFETWGLNICDKIVNFCIENANNFSIQKYSSNIIDKLIDFIIKEKNIFYFKALLSSMIKNESIYNVYNNKYGKYLLVKILKIIPFDDKIKLKSQLLNKKIVIKDKKTLSIILNIINKKDL